MTNFTSPYTIVANPHALAGRGGRLRKRGGQVVSFAPQMLDLCAGVSRVALGGLLVLGGMIAAPDAMAGGCSSDPASICSGPAASDGTDTPVIVSDPGNNVSITTLPGFGLNTSDTAADGITLDGNNASFIDDHASSITAQETALNISNGAGSAIITSTGSLTGGVGGTGSGLVVNNAAGAEDVLINVNDVQGQDAAGIDVTNNGTGTTSINAAGAVSGATGIVALHTGDGALSINSSETITGTSGAGIAVLASSADGIEINTADVSAYILGIGVSNSGDGDTSITSTGTVSSEFLFGVAVFSTGTGSTTIDTVDISAADGAAIVVNQNAGNVDISSTGTLSGAVGVGVQTGTASDSVTIGVNTVQATSYAGILVDHEGTGGVDITATGAVTSADFAAIAVTAGPSSGDVTITTSGAVSGTTGIYAQHYGNGTLAISNSESVTGTADYGIMAFANNAGGIDISTVDVSANGIAIAAVNLGDGDVSISSNGTITSDTQVGVSVLSNGAGSTAINTVDVNAANYAAILVMQDAGNVEISSTGTLSGNAGVVVETGTASDSVNIAVNNVQSTFGGISVDHEGTGGVDITATGDVVAATNGDGIFVEVSNNSTGPISIAANNVTAVEAGIYVDSYGTGDILVDATGLIQSSDSDGILIYSDGAAVEVNANNIDAYEDGIRVAQYGDGDVSVTTTGDIAAGNEGILVEQYGDGDVTVTSTGEIVASSDGIRIDLDGEGDVLITATGDIVAGADGIDVDTSSDSTGNITINAVNITADDHGIELDSYGSGNIDIMVQDITAADDGMNLDHGGVGILNVTSTGTITADDDGISVFADTGSGDILIQANNITADNNGIAIDTYGDGVVDITVSGTVEGSQLAILVVSDDGQATSIQNDGTLRNSDLLSTSDAIQISGGPVDITNNNSIVGNIFSSASDDAFVNNGTWNNVGGTSDFGGGNDLLTNSTTGIILAANDSAVAETTTIVGLANLTNNGLITLADGAAGDVFSTDGNAAFGATSTLSVDIGGAGVSDLFVAGGDIVLDDGALDVNLIGALPTIGTEFTVLQGDTVTGEFDFDDQYYTAFLGLRDSYTPDSVVLSFTQLRDLADAGLTPNQISTANGLDSLPLTNGLLASVLYLNTDAEAQSAFDQLSGDIHPGVRTALAEDSRLPRNAVMERLSNPEGGAVWGQLFWNTGDSDGNRNTAPIKRETWGFIAGADAGLGENAVVGISGAYLSNDLDQRQRASDGKLETIHVLGYVGAQAGQFRFKAGVGYAWGNIETTRNVSFTGFSDKLIADYDATLFQAFAEAGIQLPIGGGYIEPIAQVAFLRAKTDGFTETGGLAALTAQSEVEKSTISTIGARFSTSQSGNFSVGGLVGWQHSYGSIDPQTRFSFAGGDSFSIAGVPQSRNAGVANVEARFQLSPGSSIGLGYDGVLGTASQDHAAKLSFRFAF